ncbi:MAG: endonuclease/exonuclease/phosphatase family protein [Pseudomonadota bacterium]
MVMDKAGLRIATYNVEWFNALFDDEARPLVDDGPSARHRITRRAQFEALGRVFTALKADVVMVVEAPDTIRQRDTIRALERFAARFELRARKAVMGFVNQTQQELALLYDPDRVTLRHDPRDGGAHAPRFDTTFRFDLDVDAAPEAISFSKPPLEAVLEVGGHTLRLIGCHVKSKAPHGATDPQSVMRISIENRRKQLAQCVWMRRRVDAHLEAGDDVILLGDLNDGPGLDEYEKLFGRSGVEIVLGSGEGALYDPHARMALTQRLGASHATARFYNKAEGRYFQALLDYIMVSPGLRRRARTWRIWHPFDDPPCYNAPELRDALLTASDHFPVTLDLELGG